MSFYKNIARPVLFRFDPELAHGLAHCSGKLLQKTGLLRAEASKEQKELLGQKLFDLDFNSPLGLAAGFDKAGELAPLMERLGFGFVEQGSVTNQASLGNPKPRLFRLPKDRAVINRLGLNNPGPKEFLRNRSSVRTSIPRAVNIAKTHSPDILGSLAIEDILSCYKEVADSASFTVLNISCPNTAEGKTFETEESLRTLLEALAPVRLENSPLLLKFSVDLPFSELEKLILIGEEFDLAGYVLSNTSSKRKDLSTDETVVRSLGAGGLSGNPIFEKSLQNLKFARSCLGNRRVLIGLGGIDSAERAYEYVKAGASLVEVYTGLIYEGPFLVSRINRGLCELLKRDGLSNISEAVGVES